MWQMIYRKRVNFVNQEIVSMEDLVTSLTKMEKHVPNLTIQFADKNEMVFQKGATYLKI